MLSKCHTVVLIQILLRVFLCNRPSLTECQLTESRAVSWKRFCLTSTSYLWSTFNKSRTFILITVNINPATKILLVNALYFKSFWRHSFNKSATRGGCFYNSGACRTVAMMELQAELNYAYVENLRAHAVELPYEVILFCTFIIKVEDFHERVAFQCRVVLLTTIYDLFFLLS